MEGRKQSPRSDIKADDQEASCNEVQLPEKQVSRQQQNEGVAIRLKRNNKHGWLLGTKSDGEQQAAWKRVRRTGSGFFRESRYLSLRWEGLLGSEQAGRWTGGAGRQRL